MSQGMRTDDTPDGRGGDDVGSEDGFDGRTAALRHLIEPSIEEAGFDLVRVEIMKGGGQTLQIMIERKDRVPVNVDDCADVSRLLSAILDVEDPLPGRYTLEVSSPGLDRPLVRLDDYVRFAGFEARIEMHRPFEGRRRYRGRLQGVEQGVDEALVKDEASVKIECEGEVLAIPFTGIRRASLVVTDDLIAAATREAEAALSKQ